MQQVATITSKRQMTIPSKIFRKAGFSKGDKVLVEEEDGVISLRRALSQVEKLAGSVEVSEKLREVDVDEAIEKAKRQRFSKEGE